MSPVPRSEERHDPHRPGRCRQRGIHAQPAGRLPVLSGAARRHDRAPRHRRGAAARRPGGWPNGPRRAGRRAPDRGPPRPPGGPAGRRHRGRHDPGRRSAGHPGRLRHPGPLRPALHDQRHDQRRRRHARPALDPGRPGHRPRHGGRSARTRGSSTTRTRWRCSSGPSRRRPASRPSASATRSSGRSTRSPATWACRAAEVDSFTAGVNHLAFVLRLEHRGRDLYPDLAAFVRRRSRPRRRPRAGGAVPAPRAVPDRVVRAPRRVQPLVHPEGRPRRAPPHPDRRVPSPRRPQPRRVRRDPGGKLDAGEPFEIERSGEYAAVIAHSC